MDSESPGDAIVLETSSRLLSRDISKLTRKIAEAVLSEGGDVRITVEIEERA